MWVQSHAVQGKGQGTVGVGEVLQRVPSRRREPGPRRSHGARWERPAPQHLPQESIHCSDFSQKQA